MTWHSEYGQDRWLVENVFGDRFGGTFVEAGALWGVLHSNTLHFESERGWRGVLIEPNPEMHSALRANRPAATIVTCALGAAGTAAFEASIVAGWSGLADLPHARRATLPATQRRRYQVGVRPLAAVLREAGIGAVDYLSLDIEGGECAVLAAFPFDEIPIEVIGVEDNEANNQPLRDLLAAAGYRHLARVGVDEFWARG